MLIRLLMDWGNCSRGELVDMADEDHARQMKLMGIADDPSRGNQRVIRLERGEKDATNHHQTS